LSFAFLTVVAGCAGPSSPEQCTAAALARAAQLQREDVASFIEWADEIDVRYANLLDSLRAARWELETALAMNRRADAVVLAVRAGAVRDAHDHLAAVRRSAHAVLARATVYDSIARARHSAQAYTDSAKAAPPWEWNARRGYQTAAADWRKRAGSLAERRFVLDSTWQAAYHSNLEAGACKAGATGAAAAATPLLNRAFREAVADAKEWRATVGTALVRE
jgi:hypothetical protein